MFNSGQFPNAAKEGYEPTSPQSMDYNCVAWAANDQTRTWWPYPDIAGNEAYWPKGCPRILKIKAFIKAFETLRYKQCANGDQEEGYEKIAIYATDNNVPTHVARQLPDGKWTHKVGWDIDVTASLLAMGGGAYGTVARYMRRKLLQK